MHPVLCTCDRCNHFGNHKKGESMTDKELLELAAKAADAMYAAIEKATS